MGRLLDGLSWLVTVRPRVTLPVLAAITVFLAAGIAFRPSQADSSAFPSQDSDVAVALGKVQERFGGTAQTVSATVLLRDDALTPNGLDQIGRAIQRVVEDPEVFEVLAPDNAVVSPTLILARALGHSDFASVSQDEIDSLLERIRQVSELAPASATIDRRPTWRSWSLSQSCLASPPRGSNRPLIDESSCRPAGTPAKILPHSTTRSAARPKT